MFFHRCFVIDALPSIFLLSIIDFMLLIIISVSKIVLETTIPQALGQVRHISYYARDLHVLCTWFFYPRGAGLGMSMYGSSLVPRPPFNTARGKGGLVNIVQHFCRSAEFRLDNLICNYATVLGFLTANHLALLITTLETSLAHPPIYWSPARDFKGLAFSGIHSNS